MPTELQELQLRVGLINEASDGLGRLRDELKQLSSGSGKQAMDKFKQEQAELAKMVKDLGVTVSRGGEAMAGYIGKFGVAGAAMGAMAGTILIGLNSFKEFADKIVTLTNKAKVIGMEPAELKSLIEQYDRLGVSAGVVENSMAGLSGVIAEVNRIGSKKRMEMIEAAGAWGELMAQGIDRVEAQTTMAGRLNEIMLQAQNVYDNRLKETNGNIADATKSENDFLKLWGLDPSLKVLDNFHKVTDEEKKRLAEQEKATAAYRKVVTDLGVEWENFSDDIKTSLLSSDGVIVSSLQFMVRIIKELHELWDKPWFGEGVKTGVSAVAHAVPIVGPLLTAVDMLKGTKAAPETSADIPPHPTAPLAPLTSDAIVPAGAGAGQTFNERWPVQAPTEAHHKAVLGSLGPSWSSAKDREQVDDSLRHGDDYVKTIDANTKETKRLNENFRLLDQGQVELKGLGGLPGFDSGEGGGAAPGGGATPGSGGSGGGGGSSSGDVGPGRGGDAERNRGDVGGGGGGGTPEAGGPAQLSDQRGAGIDAQTMKDVETLGRAGDVQGLQTLFAKKGYRMSGAACGMIATKYVRDAGYKPPSGSAVATSWHKWGEKLDPNDINAAGGHPFGSMVATYWHRRYGGDKRELLRTGEQGGHVMTIVPGSYNEKTGTVDVVDQYGYHHGKRTISDLDLRFAGDEAVAAVAAKRGDVQVAKGDVGKDRATVDAADKGAGDKKVRTVNVEVNGKLTADVNAPKGSDVKVEGGGAFNKTETNRQMPLS
jgi:hypothetical protein